MRSCFMHAAEMAAYLELMDDADHWKKLVVSLEEPILSDKNQLMFAKGHPYNESHRHFSHLMSIYPLGTIKWEHGEKNREIINQSLKQLDSIGPSQWVGYSYAWQGNLKARAHDGDGAAKALKIFAEAFCLPNSFHVNGDQTGKGYANTRYKPFTLEGNFAFASGILEMLIQSHAGYIEVMPAIPKEWKDVSFHQLRTEGAFLVSADMKDGKKISIHVKAEKGGLLQLKLPIEKFTYTQKGTTTVPQVGDDKVFSILAAGDELTIQPEY